MKKKVIPANDDTPCTPEGHLKRVTDLVRTFSASPFCENAYLIHEATRYAFLSIVGSQIFKKSRITEQMFHDTLIAFNTALDVMSRVSVTRLDPELEEKITKTFPKKIKLRYDLIVLLRDRGVAVVHKHLDELKLDLCSI